MARSRKDTYLIVGMWTGAFVLLFGFIAWVTLVQQPTYDPGPAPTTSVSPSP